MESHEDISTYHYNEMISFLIKPIKNNSEKELKETQDKLSDIFDQWKIECGELLHFKTPFYSMLADSTNEPLSDQERHIRLSQLHPWECHQIANDPLSLFWQLKSDEYPELVSLCNDKSLSLENILCALVSLYSEHLTKKSVFETYMIFSSIYLEYGNEGIKKKWNDHIRAKNIKLTKDKEGTFSRELIISTHDKLKSDDSRPIGGELLSKILKEKYPNTSGLSKSRVYRVLKEINKNSQT